MAFHGCRLCKRVGAKLTAILSDPPHLCSALKYLTAAEFILLTACVMDRVPPTPQDVFPQHYYVDWVRVTA